jgi:hypothetical protein
VPDQPSTSPLVKKLGIKPGHRLLFVHEPADFRGLLVGLPTDVVFDLAADEPADVIVLFVIAAAGLQREFSRLKERLVRGGGLWVAWPKKTSGVATDVTFEVVQPTGLNTGLVDNKICAIDPTWTGLRFVYRKADKT